MKEKELQLVTFEQAKKLKASGFDWETSEKYCNGELSAFCEGFDDWNNRGRGGYISAPTVALALKWMRDEKGYESMVHRSYIDNTKYLGEVYKCNVNNVEPRIIEVKRIKPQNSHEAAESALLDAILTTLEEEEQQ